ncbi:MAG: IS1634 family transposase [Bacillota bacterium]
MFFRKITSKIKGKEYNYLKLIENYREGNKVKQRVIANLGNLEDLTPEKVHVLISGLSRICGVSRGSAQLEAKKVLRYGEVLAIHRIWELLQIHTAIDKAISKDKADLNVPLLSELLSINQVIKPQNKHAINDWHQFLCLTGSQNDELNTNHFYSALDIMAEVKYHIEKSIFTNLNRLFSINTELVFCRLVNGAFEPPPKAEFNSSIYGRYILEEPDETNKADFGIMVSRDGMPFGHWVFQNASAGREYRNILEYLGANYSADKCIFVGDRNVMTNTSLELLVAHGYEFIIGRRFRPTQDIGLYREHISGNNELNQLNGEIWYKEVSDGNIRRLLCCDLQSVRHKATALEEQINLVEKELRTIQRAAAESRNKPSKHVFNKNADIFKNNYCHMYFEWRYDESTKDFNYRRRDDLIEQDKQQAGMFLLETNSSHLSGREMLEAYIRTARMGESLRTISSFEHKPVHHYVNKNTSASIFICLLASILESTLERLLHRAGINLHPRQALELLEDIKLSINQLDDQEVKSVTRIPKTQEEILRAIGVHTTQQIII